MKGDKAIEKMRRNKRNWTIPKLKVIAARCGMTCTTNGSTHHVFRLEGVAEHLSVPASGKDIHPDYITKFLRLIDKIGEK
jgi:hypothetical protein